MAKNFIYYFLLSRHFFYHRIGENTAFAVEAETIPVEFRYDKITDIRLMSDGN